MAYCPMSIDTGTPGSRHTLPLLMALPLIIVAEAADTTGPELGQPAAAAEIAAWNTDVGIDGAGLPPGEGSVESGRTLYEAHCEICHGPEGIGGSADEL